MKTIAKFECVHVNSKGEDAGTDVILHAVTSGSEENDNFFNATPYGQIQLSIKNELASKLFEQYKQYYVTFEEAS